MRLAKGSKSDPFLALLDFRNTPTQSMDSSPAQRLMGQRTQTKMPTKATLLKPESHTCVSHKLETLKERQAHYYNRGAKDLKPLTPGDVVCIAPTQGQQDWRQATVKREVATHSYEVETNSGQTLRCKPRHLRKTSEMTPTSDVVNMDHNFVDTSLRVAEPTNCASPIMPSPTMSFQPDVKSTKSPIVTRLGRTGIKPTRLDI